MCETIAETKRCLQKELRLDYLKYETLTISIALTKYSEVDHVLPVSRGKRGVLADVGSFVRQLQAGEHDGGVLQQGHVVADRRLLEGDALLEGRQDGHAEGRVGYGHVLLGAVEEFLPGDLGDLNRRVAVDEDAAQLNL